MDSFTKRINFNSKTSSYSNIFMVENENRFYCMRFSNRASNFFISTFENIGAGFAEDKVDFLWSAGLGAGYNLFTVVPFTMQFGIDHTLSPVLSLFIVSPL